MGKRDRPKEPKVRILGGIELKMRAETKAENAPARITPTEVDSFFQRAEQQIPQYRQKYNLPLDALERLDSIRRSSALGPLAEKIRAETIYAGRLNIKEGSDAWITARLLKAYTD